MISQLVITCFGVICAGLLVNADEKEGGLRIFCPADQLVYSDDIKTRIDWNQVRTIKAPGAKYPPRIYSNRRPGNKVSVPGVYNIRYTARDQLGNVAKCNFTVTVKRPSCQLPQLPKNGILVCDKEWEKTKKNIFCAIMCKDGYDIPKMGGRTTLLRVCTYQAWNDFPKYLQNGATDCSAKGTHNLPPQLYYKGDIESEEVKAEVKKSFRKFMMTFTGFCYMMGMQVCNEGGIEIFS